MARLTHNQLKKQAAAWLKTIMPTKSKPTKPAKPTKAAKPAKPAKPAKAKPPHQSTPLATCQIPPRIRLQLVCSGTPVNLLNMQKLYTEIIKNIQHTKNPDPWLCITLDHIDNISAAN